MDAEQEFANVAFDILNMDALFEILKELDPATVLSLCQTNQRFAELCRDQDVFRNLMRVHYPNFPINEDAKAQYGDITSEKETTYSINIIDKESTPIKLDNRAYINERASVATFRQISRDDLNLPSINFNILGTRIRKGEKLWLMVISKSNGFLNIAEVFSNKEDAVKAMPIYNEVGLEVYVDRMKRDYLIKIRSDEIVDSDETIYRVETPASTINRKRGLLAIEDLASDDPGFLEFLRDEGYHLPLSYETMYEDIMRNKYIRMPGRVIHLQRLDRPRADLFVTEFIIE